MISLERISWGASMDIVSWLRNLGFGRYEQAFIENAIDSDVLPELTEGDLEKLGIPLGDRKRLIKAIREMLAGPPGAFITGEIEGDTQGAQPRGVPAERRHLTVMICDLVGFDCPIGPTRSGGHGRRDAMPITPPAPVS